MDQLLNTIFWIFCLIISVLGIIAFKDHQFQNLNSYYTIILLYSIFVFSVHYLSQFYKTKSIVKINFKLIYLSFIVVISAAYLYFSLVHLSSIWLDEFLQSLHSISFEDITILASEHSQPPLHYLMTSLSLNTFGMTESSLRVISILSTILSSLIFFLILFEITKKSILSFIGGIIFFTNPWISWYAVEGRPYALSILMMLFVLRFILKQIDSSERIYFKELFVSLLMYFLTINVQPQIFLLMVLISLLVCHQSFKDIKVTPFFLILVTSFSLVTPLLFEIYSHSSGQLGESVFNILSSLQMSFSALKISTSLFGFRLSSNYIFYLFLVIYVIGIFFRKNKLILFFLVLSPLYLALNPFIFVFILKVPFYIRYSIIAFPLSLMGFILILNEILSKFQKKFLMNIYLFLPFIYMSQFANYKYEKSTDNINWKYLYNYFDSHALKNSVAYTLYYVDRNEWYYDGFLSASFYPQNKVKLRQIDSNFHNNPDFSYFIMKDLEDGLQPSEIYFVQVADLSKFQFNISAFKKIDAAYFRNSNFEIFKLKIAKDFYNTVLQFYKILEEQSQKKFLYRNTYQGLMRLALYKNNCSVVSDYYKILTEIYKLKNLKYFDNDAYMKCKEVQKL